MHPSSWLRVPLLIIYTVALLGVAILFAVFAPGLSSSGGWELLLLTGPLIEGIFFSMVISDLSRKRQIRTAPLIFYCVFAALLVLSAPFAIIFLLVPIMHIGIGVFALLGIIVRLSFKPLA